MFVAGQQAIEAVEAIGAEAIGAFPPEETTAIAAVEREAYARRTGRLLRAVEAYKAACAAQGQRPNEEDSWLVLIAALNAPFD